jgi:hypothetical protein
MRSRRDLEDAREFARLHVAERLVRLPEVCEEILDDQSRDEREWLAWIAFDGLPYAAVARLAIRLEVVRRAIALLPAHYSRWAR